MNRGLVNESPTLHPQPKACQQGPSFSRRLARAVRTRGKTIGSNR